MDLDVYKIEMLDIVKEIKAYMVINYHTAQITLYEEDLELMKKNGLPTNVMSCVYAGFIFAGKSMEDIQTYMEDAEKCNAGLSVEFIAPDGQAIDIKSELDNPKFNQLVQLFGVK